MCSRERRRKILTAEYALDFANAGSKIRALLVSPGRLLKAQRLEEKKRGRRVDTTSTSNIK